MDPEIQESNEEEKITSEGRRGLKERWDFFRKGLTFLVHLNGIVIIGGYPYPSRRKDGFFQRIKDMDDLLSDKTRIYLDRLDNIQKDFWFDKPAPNTLVLNISGRRRFKWMAGVCAILCILRTHTVYFHSVLSIKKFLWLIRWPLITKIVEFHGVVPEEFQYQNDIINARIYNRIEETAVANADYLIVVSEAMKQHFTQKYKGSLTGQLITMPTLPGNLTNRIHQTYKEKRPVIIYAGGLQEWQQVPKMLDVIKKTAHVYQYKFFCPYPEEVKALLPDSLISSHQVEVNRKTHRELIQEYQEADFGFILREDVIVNHVACPTKLVEYIAMGIVPIVDCADIGDFKSLGMKYVNVENLQNEDLPDEDVYFEMVEDNYAVYEALRKSYLDGVLALQQALA